MNLVEARWIPVARVGGGRDRVGLAACFTEADRISRVRAGSVLEDRAVERLLIAICLRAGGPDWAASYLQEHRDQFRADRFCQYSVRAASSKASFGMDRLVLDPAGAAAPESLGQGDAVRAMLARMLFDPSGIRTGLADDPMSSGGRSMPIGPALLAAVPSSCTPVRWPGCWPRTPRPTVGGEGTYRCGRTTRLAFGARTPRTRPVSAGSCSGRAGAFACAPQPPPVTMMLLDRR